MKKSFLLLAGLILLAFTACQNDELVNGGSGNETAVSFSVQLPGANAPSTRAAGDGTQVNRCIMEIYLGDKLYGERQVVPVDDKTATFNVRLVTSQTYDFVFWADVCGEGGIKADRHYQTANGLQNISLLGNYAGNDDSRDAFTGVLLSKLVTGAFNEAVELTRPFGQLNIKTTDLESIPTDRTALIPATASLAFKGVYKGFNAHTGAVTGDLAALSYNENAAVVDGDGALTMDYLFAPKEGQLLTNMVLTMNNAAGEKITDKELSNIPVQRNYKTNVTGSMLTVSGQFVATLEPAFTDNLNKDVMEVSNITEAADALTKCDNVVVATAPTEDATIALPKYTTADKAVSITLPETTNHTVTINYASSTETSNPPKELTIIAPQTKKLVIDAKQTTVYLNGTKYEEIEAGTAENTLVINDGVTVSKLTVNAGNVKVFGKGTITEIVKGTANNDTIIYIYASNQAQLPANLPQDFEKVSLEAENLKEAMAEGGVYQLKEDVDITGRSIEIPANKTATLDLNGNTITAANRGVDGIAVYGNLTLKDSKGNGRIVANKDYTGGTYGAGLIRIIGENAAMIMQGGTIYAARENATNNGQYGVAVYEGGDFTITGGKIEAGWSAVLGNGKYKTQNSVIRIEGGELISTSDYAVYLPQSGTTTISGGKVYGVGGGVCINRGTLNVEGTALITSKGTGDTGDWGDGTGNMESAAINVAAKYGDCVVNIKGGTLTAEANALVSTGNAGYTPAINVSGGTFSDPSLLGHLSAGANVKVKLLKDYEGPGLGIFYGKNGSRATVEVDLNQYAWNLTNDPLFGSTGYQNQYFHLEKDAFVTFRNGTVQPKEVASGRMLIQNYCHLTLDKVKLIGGSSCKYVISNNNGSCTISNSTITAAAGQCAFDVYSYKPYPGGVTVTVNGQSVINGRVEFDGNSGKKNGNLVINGGTINGNLSANNDYYDSINKNIIIKEGVTFGADVTGWDDYK